MTGDDAILGELSLHELWKEASWKQRALLPFIAILALAVELLMPNPYHCPECRAELVGRGHNCPECGHAFTTRGEVRNLRRELNER